jgi:hypothetical protein
MYFSVDLGSPQTFDQLQMAVPNSPYDYARGYNVEVSLNGTTWTTVASCTGTSTPEVVSFPTQWARYVQVVLTTGADSVWWSIDEFNLYGVTTCTGSVNGTALSRTGWVAKSNTPSSTADAPANALDGNLSTRFSSGEDQAPSMKFWLDLGSPQTFDQLQMEVPNSPNDYARGYVVMVSLNGTSWATVARCTGTSAAEVVTFPTQSARYVQVVLTASTSWWWSIDELNLYNTSTAATTTTTSTSTTTTVPSTTTTTVPSSTTTTVPNGNHHRRGFRCYWTHRYFGHWHHRRALVCVPVHPRHSGR